jgi:hypothetical protein
MKERVLLKYSFLLFSNNLEEFETNLTKQFLVYFGKLLPREYYSIQFEIESDPRKLMMLSQFINYAQSVDYERNFLGFYFLSKSFL